MHAEIKDKQQHQYHPTCSTKAWLLTASALNHSYAHFNTHTSSCPRTSHRPVKSIALCVADLGLVAMVVVANVLHAVEVVAVG